MQYYGYAGKVLHVDLTREQTRAETLDIKMAEKYIGGCGVGVRLLCDILKPNTDPLSPDNPIIISAGPLVGTLAPSSSKIQLITKSATPASKQQRKYYIGLSSAGSNRFGIMMKNAGYDQILITGRASRPVYLKIVDDEVKICNAGDLWGRKDIFETTDELTKRHKGAGVIAIGKAGENQVVFSLAFVDKRDTIGRNGGAAVMGSKNLKAIVVKGAKGIRVWNSEKFLRLVDSMAIETKRQLTETKIVVPSREKVPSAKKPELEWDELYAPELEEMALNETRACTTCLTPCRHTYRIKTGEFAGTELALGFWGHVPRYGKYLEIKDYRHTMKLLDVCNRTGVCYVTALAMIRFLTELYERGVISKRDTEGVELEMGGIWSYLRLVENIANRTGIGDHMARGWYALSERVGVDDDSYENGRGVIKGTSVIIGAEERGLPLLLGTIVNPRGGMHLHPVTYLPNLSMDDLKQWCQGLAMSKDSIKKIVTRDDFDCGRLEKHIEDGECVYWALGICVDGVIRGSVTVRLLAELYTNATGIEITPEKLKQAGERIWNLYKLLNIREGFMRADDNIPALWARSMKEPIKKYILGELRVKDYFGRAVTRAGFERVLDNYYDERGWDIKRGVPTRMKIEELGLENFGYPLDEVV